MARRQNWPECCSKMCKKTPSNAAESRIKRRDNPRRIGIIDRRLSQRSYLISYLRKIYQKYRRKATCHRRVAADMEEVPCG